MPSPSAEQFSGLLDAAANGDANAAEQLLPLVYEQLRVLAEHQIAREPAGQTLQPTALVHEAYIRLIGSRKSGWDGRRHFFAAAARSMRQILVNRAHKRRTQRHGGGRGRVNLADVEPGKDEPPADEMLALDDALKRLEERAPRQAQVVMFRYFAGLSVDDTAQALGISPRTVDRDWQFAKAWLYSEMS